MKFTFKTQIFVCHKYRVGALQVDGINLLIKVMCILLQYKAESHATRKLQVKYQHFKALKSG